MGGACFYSWGQIFDLEAGVIWFLMWHPHNQYLCPNTSIPDTQQKYKWNLYSENKNTYPFILRTNNECGNFLEDTSHMRHQIFGAIFSLSFRELFIACSWILLSVHKVYRFRKCYFCSPLYHRIRRKCFKQVIFWHWCDISYSNKRSGRMTRLTVL